MKLYLFDEAGAGLERLPLAARRVLDAAGLKLSLTSWQGLNIQDRSRLVQLGSEASVDGPAVRELLANTAAEEAERCDEPPDQAPPQRLIEAYADWGRLTPAIWSSLSSLDRYALAKVVGRVQARAKQSGADALSLADAAKRLGAAYEEIVGHTQISTHLRASGGVQMVNVGVKAVTKRRAEAQTQVLMSAEAFELLAAHRVPKGDVLGTARIAGIMAAKRTADLIPLCHTLSLTHVGIDLRLEPARRAVEIVTVVETTGKTGVEMEALVAASTAALTVYDMLKAADRSMQIGPTRLVKKSGGASGDFEA